MELTALIREVAGPDVELLIDAHGRFDVPTAIRLGQSLDEAGGIHWYEEPVPPESYHALKQVRERVRVPISVGERLHTRWDFVPVLENGLADFVMPDVTWTGGISELKKIATMAEAYYVPVSPTTRAGRSTWSPHGPRDDHRAELLPDRVEQSRPGVLQQVPAYAAGQQRR